MTKIRVIWETWKKVGQFIGDFVARVVLTLFYVTIMAPFGLGMRLFGDPLAIKRQRAGWMERTTHAHDKTLDDARRLS